MVASEVVKEALWLRGLVSKLLKVKELETTTIHCGNQSKLSLSKNQVHHDRTKHMDVKYHFIRDVINGGVVAIKKITIEENVVDMPPKALPFEKFNYCLQLLNVISLE